MDDAELQAIRARRLAELRGAHPSDSPAGVRIPGMPAQQDRDQDAKKTDAEEMRRNMLFQILDNQARERLARIRIVKNDKARAVEDMLLRMAQTGQIRAKVTESQLIGFLEQISTQHQSTTKITYNRRRGNDSDDEDDWDL